MLLDQTIVSASKRLKNGSCSSYELTEAYCSQIFGINGLLHAYLSIFEEDAFVAARASDDRRVRGDMLGLLDGIPIAIKDNILIKGAITTAGSRVLEHYKAPVDATVIEKLRAQGAIFLGKTNMDEFAMGSSTEHSAFGPTKHPRDIERVPGGTSGGSACAVAADLCVAALGSDTGGSVRQPASFCGVVGLKPTYGRVSRYGLLATASSFDQIGPITKNVEDSLILFQAIQGADKMDETTIDKPLRVAFRQSLNGVRIGLPKEAWCVGMQDCVRTRVEQAIDVLKALGAHVQEISLPYTDEALAIYYVLNFSEISSNLARYDGMRYGLRDECETLHETYSSTRGNALGDEVRRRIMLGTYTLSKGYADAFYHRANKARKLIREAYAHVLKDVDVLITPTAPSTAWKIGEKTSDPLMMYLEDVFTVGVNVTGVPALSVPCGDYEGLPVGMQLIGKMFDEEKLFEIGWAYEQAVK